MEIALGAGSLLASAGGGLSSLMSGSSALTVLQGGLSAASALSSMGAGRAKAAALQEQATNSRIAAEAQAGQMGRNADALRDAAGYKFMAADFTRSQADLGARSSELEASQEYLAGRNTVVALREDLGRKVAATRVGFAAAGVDPTSGTAARRVERQEQVATRDMEMATANATILQQQALLKAGQIRSQGAFSAFGAETEGRQQLFQADQLDIGAMETLRQGNATEAAAARQARYAERTGMTGAFAELAKFGVDYLKRK